ncbi:protein RGF1 INDUCIBLE TRANSCRIPTION FACTOR 1-like [Capsicum galapagoense]
MINKLAKKVGSDSITNIPKWLEVLLDEKFFNSCLVHEYEKKNEENTFCLDCCLTLCIHCLPSHQNHKLLQIRRYIYQDVLLLKEANKVLDCSFVQPYTTNSAKVVFLNQRPISRQDIKCSINYTCITCHKSLQRPNKFCSISCKVQHMISCSNVKSIIKYQKFISNCESLLKLIEDQKTSSSCSTSTSLVAVTLKSSITDSNHTSINVSTCSSASDGSCAHRRKGVPQRSPLC